MKTEIFAVLGKNGEVIRWAYKSITDLMKVFFALCEETNIDQSIIEEKSRYLQSPYINRNTK